MEIQKDSVAFLMPCSGPVDPRVLQSMGALISFATGHGFHVTQVGITDRTLVHSARNTLAKGFLETDCEWAFWMDSDMILEPRTIPVMINWMKRLGGRAATGIYYQRLGEHRPLIFLKDPKTADGKSIHAMPDEYSHCAIIPRPDWSVPFGIDAAGFGCFLTHRSVFDEMTMPYFINHVFKNDKEVSEDFYFCIKTRRKGIDIYAVPELKCGHIGQGKIIYAEDFTAPESDKLAECIIKTARQSVA
jgi:GT2 family glycosyltransferase